MTTGTGGPGFQVLRDDGEPVEIVLTAERLAIEDVRALAATLRELPGGTRGVLLRSAGADFCLGRAPDSSGPRTPEQVSATVTTPILDLYSAVNEAPFVVVAAVRGRATGLGFALAGSCDAVVTAADAQFSLPESAAGFAPLLALSQLVHVLPRPMAFHLAVTGAAVEGSRLHAVGAVAVAVASAEVDEVARAYLLALPARPAVDVKNFLARRDAHDRGLDARYADAELSAVLSRR